MMIARRGISCAPRRDGFRAAITLISHSSSSACSATAGRAPMLCHACRNRRFALPAHQIRSAPARARRSRRAPIFRNTRPPSAGTASCSSASLRTTRNGPTGKPFSASQVFCRVLSWMIRIGSTPGRSGAMLRHLAQARPRQSAQSPASQHPRPSPVAAPRPHRPSGPQWSHPQQSSPGSAASGSITRTR